jgi:aspartate/methionine/tyrosine aminotransferase
LAGGPRRFGRTRARANEFIISHAPSFGQRAAETALRDGEAFIAEMLAGYRANRDYCLRVLRSLKGITVPEPSGAFYLFPRVDGLTDSFAFCKQLLLATKAGLAPGVAFGAGGEGSVRLCYASERAILDRQWNVWLASSSRAAGGGVTCNPGDSPACALIHRPSGCQYQRDDNQR